MKLAATLLALLIGVAMPPPFLSNAKVIANPSVTISFVTSEELKGVLLSTKTALAAGGHVEPVLLKSGAVHEAFVKQFTGKTPAALENYYRSLVFTGKGSMPKRFSSDAEMVAYVRATKGAIGYVSAGASTDGVKVLEVR
jgi:hypothetical protein